MTTETPAFHREVVRLDDPATGPGQVAGHRARRLIDGRDPVFTDPFLLMAEDWMPHGAFPLHPHRGIETVTVVLDGVLEHRDSAGHSGRLMAGDAQWMTAGRGIRHEETAPQGATTHSLQLWINLPSALKMTEPRYQDLVGASTPTRREAGVEVRVFSGRSGEAVSPTLNHVPVTMIDARLDPGASFHQRLAAADNAFVYVLEGAARIGGDKAKVRPGQIGWLTRSDEGGTSVLEIASEESAVRLLMFAGRPLREPVVFGGPFVMTTQDEIAQAFTDYRNGRL